jgi:hypothetical protein
MVERLCGLPQGDDLCVCCRIAICFAAVVPAPDDLIVVDGDCADGHITVRFGKRRFFERKAHPVQLIHRLRQRLKRPGWVGAKRH